LIDGLHIGRHAESVAQRTRRIWPVDCQLVVQVWDSRAISLSLGLNSFLLGTELSVRWRWTDWWQLSITR